MKLDDKYKLNLQFFAEDGEGDSGKDNDDKVPENDDDNPNKESKFTQSEVDSQISKAVETALSKRERKHQQELEKAKEEAKKEAESYAKLTEKEKKEKEYEKREKALAEKEKQFKLRELKADVESDLKEKGLPTSFAESLIHLEDAEQINEVVKAIKQDFDNAVQEQVKEATRQSTPSNQSS
ncbi:capsid assembly scaffolding protein Gp46 family protein, partial [Staphylococcus capitis]